MKNILVLSMLALLTGCGLKYESYVEGSAVAPKQVQVAVNDLIDVFDRSDVTADAVVIYPAEGDRIMRLILEHRLRRSGYAVSASLPASVLSAPKKPQPDAVPIRYRASIVDGIGTFCLLITGEKKMLCRMYDRDGKPVSCMTHKGIRIERDKRALPTDLQPEQRTDKRAETDTAEPMFDSKEPHKPFAPAFTGDSKSESDPTETTSSPVNTPRYRPLPTELLRENLERFISALHEDAPITMVTDRLDGESDKAYRRRLLQYMNDANHYIRTGVVSAESTLRVSAND